VQEFHKNRRRLALHQANWWRADGTLGDNSNVTDRDNELRQLIDQVAADAEAARESDDVDLSGVNITRGGGDRRPRAGSRCAPRKPE
jgi:hypothetical protein